ncbi:hypothetical protein [Alteromonas australica]|uniref:hypothetical protein n=1 Tax=Alteromonas australica TaxID=589873 RepID=UPI0035C78DF6
MQFIFHIGPPKTGTSAIQYWCETHRDWLLQHKIFYPSHAMDANDISSGNLLSLYSVDCVTGNLELNVSKLEQLRAEAVSLDAEIVLLSSEFFFKRVNELAEHFPTAKFLAYIRFELELLESNYNQAIKRHGRITTFKPPRSPQADSVKFLTRYIDNFGKERFILRPYSETLFKHSNIVSDFLVQILGFTPDQAIVKSRRINRRYSAEGVELKRWFNQFSISKLQEKLDLFLQVIGNESSSYSIIDKGTFEWLKKGYIDELEKFLEKTKVENKDVFLAECKDTKQNSIHIQYIDIFCFSELIRRFIDNEKTNEALLLEFYCTNVSAAVSFVDKVRMEAIYKNLSLKARLKIKRGQNNSTFKFLRSTVLKKSNAYKDEYLAFVGRGLDKLWNNQYQQRVCPQVNLVSHHIPHTTPKEFSLALEYAYGRTHVHHVRSAPKIAALKLGESIWIPAKTHVLHGHFPYHNQQRIFFPNALHVCWVRDPLERLWSYFNEVLIFKRPQLLYKNIVSLSEKQGISTIENLFDAFMLSGEFDFIKSAQSNYITEGGEGRFAFIGSVHNYAEDLPKLEEVIGRKIELSKGNMPPKVVGNKHSYEKNRLILREEYRFIENYM